jgi:putative FmdB family regulatory protein
MPRYDYECVKCGVFELSQKMNDKLLTKCPKCGAKVKRLIGSGSGIIFKGAGFYATDYKKPAAKAVVENPAKENTCPKIKEGCNGCKHKE